MSQSVTRLKELLFDSESRQLGDLQRELEALAAREHDHHADLTQSQTKIAERVDAAFDRAGSDERLLKSVAGIIDGALREAEVNRHEQLSRALAPLIVKTIKYELKNSQAEMVDALYPITGKLVKQYVRAAMNDLMADINRRLGGGRLSELEARAKAQGVSVAELVFAETQALKVDELFLVRRGSGELVAHWERESDDLPGRQSSAGSNRDVLIAGYLTGITAFSEEAFDDKKGSLRSLDMDGERIFVRASPAYLLAARCSGSAPAAVEQIIDDEFVQVLQGYKDALAQPAGASAPQADAVKALLPALAASFERRFAEKRDEIELRAAKTLAAKPRISRLQIAAALVLLPLAAWGAWTAFISYQTSRTQQAASAVVGAVEPLAGYPVQVDVSRGGRTVSVSGLAPTNAAKELLTQRLQRDVAWAEVSNNLTVLPPSQDMSPEMAALRRNLAVVDNEMTASAVRRALLRTVNRLDAVSVSLAAIKDRLSDSADRGRLEGAMAEMTSVSAQAERLRTDLASGGLDGSKRDALIGLRGKLSSIEAQIASLAGASAPIAPGAAPSDAVSLSEEVALSSERIGGLVWLADRAATIAPLGREISTLKERIDGLKLSLSPREELTQYVRANAIFFDNNADLNNVAAAERIIARLAALLARTDATLRVIGYTDERTGPTVNNAVVAQARADRVATMLVERGVPRERLVTLGRANGPDIARLTGAGTPNRRVEFDLVFEGEPVAR